MVFEKNSKETQFVEGIPLVGYIASGVHAIAGNHDQAVRAAARSTSATITTAGGIAGGAAGMVVGGPGGAVVGAMAGAAAANAAGIGVEHGVAQHINNEYVRRDVGDVSVTRFVIEPAMSAVGGAMGGIGSVAAEAAGASVIPKLVAGQVTTSVFKRAPETFIPKY